MGVSAGTMRKALDILEAERVVSRRQGRGTFVSDQASGEMRFRFESMRTESGEWVSCTFKDIEVSEGVADDRERARLQLDQRARVVRIRCVRLFNGRPCMREQSCLPEAMFPNLLQRAHSPYSILEVAAGYGVVLGRAYERISPIAADGTVAAKLEIPEGTAILELERVLHSSEGVSVQWRLAQCHLPGGHFHIDMT
ncbi:MAG: GntR family transcriptional regulator [Hyphomicrobiaceae bacterium]|nr:MAG: GntR family transcriptional regulator [Hyphomicrobiaceae bacterium]